MIRKPSKWASLFSPLPDRLTGLIPLPENREHKVRSGGLRHSVQLPRSLAKSRLKSIGVERLARVAARSSAKSTKLIPQDVTITRVTTKGDRGPTCNHGTSGVPQFVHSRLGTVDGN